MNVNPAFPYVQDNSGVFPSVNMLAPPVMQTMIKEKRCSRIAVEGTAVAKDKTRHKS